MSATEAFSQKAAQNYLDQRDMKLTVKQLESAAFAGHEGMTILGVRESSFQGERVVNIM